MALRIVCGSCRMPLGNSNVPFTLIITYLERAILEGRCPTCQQVMFVTAFNPSLQNCVVMEEFNVEETPS